MMDYSVEEDNSSSKNFASDQAKVGFNKHSSKKQKLFVSNKDCTPPDPLPMKF